VALNTIFGLPFLHGVLIERYDVLKVFLDFFNSFDFEFIHMFPMHDTL
jgi:hypothetical protein